MLEGGCECGQIRYRLATAPIFVNCCHCRQCQRLSGSAFAVNAMIEADRVALIGDADAASGLERRHGAIHCSACNTLLWAFHPMFGENILFVRAGTLDESELLPPDAHFFTRSKHPWINLPEGVPCFETLPTKVDPPLWSAEATARLKAAGR
jgi:hypothetical protein